MNIFEITIQRKYQDSWPVVVEHTKPGQFVPIRNQGILEINDDDIAALRALTGQPEKYGAALGKALFHNDIRDAFVKALATVGDGENKNNHLHVLLNIEADDLKELRWEKLCIPLDGKWVFLSLNQRTPFSLYIPAITEQLFPAIGRRDLQALVIAASPSGLGRFQLDSFDVDGAVGSIKTALGNQIPGDVLAKVDGAIGLPTLDALLQCLTNNEKYYTLVHLICHGKLLADGETAIYLSTDDNQVAPVNATTLINRLSKLRRAPHFVFLSTCESASNTAEVTGAMGGLAQRLVRELGIPAVVAMTEKVSIKTAQALATTFYEKLRVHGNVDLALSEATAGLQGRYDITVPALFSRLGGRPLFSDTPDRPLTSKEIKYALDSLKELLPERAPILSDELNQQITVLNRTLNTETKEALQEQQQALDAINTICSEVLDLSFPALALGKEPPAYDSRCPFRGLYPFRLEDREFFFGREQLIAQLQEKLAQDNFLPVLGASGSGKSSVVLAGLIPALQSQQPNLQMAYMTPTSEPIAVMQTSLSTFQGQNFVLVIDQFEELFTLCSDEAQRQKFIDKLISFSQQQKVIITMRADFWGECATYPKLKEMMQARQELIAPMDLAELRRAMEMQAVKVGLRFEAGLSNSILDEVEGEPGAMPLLQHALFELWKRRHGRWLRCVEYEAIGGVKKAISQTADDIYNRSKPEAREQIKNIFVRLTRLDEEAVQGEQRRDTRRRVGLEELVPVGGELAVTKNLVQRLAGEGARLVVTSVDESTNLEEVEVAHEALIRYWPRLLEWLNENRTDLQLRETIRQAAWEWEEKPTDDNYLVHRGGRLEDAEALLKKSGFLNQLEANYISACVELRERSALEREQRQQRQLALERQARRRLQWLVIVLGMISTAFIGYFAYREVLRWYTIWQTQMVSIPEGNATIGTNDRDANEDEMPEWHPHIRAFQIQKFEVSNRLYRLCVKAGHCDEPVDPSKLYDEKFSEHPVVQVTAFHAATYCDWLGMRLPTELEWERAARGGKGNKWPWGNDTPTLFPANVLPENKTQGTGIIEVNKPTKDKSIDPEGIYNLVGNVEEWTASYYQESYFKYDQNLVWLDADPKQLKSNSLVVRGGNWRDKLHSLTWKISTGREASSHTPQTGIRCAK
ncbi:SUMF1/EgtB/PvdO family nonheme iron enzyme [Nostoc sp. FACHB-280]|uniref:nSTAND1 domain-containing NTPase n=1 Tax=Nostoc sp. FACHB-280 TaxID=2692839 RepID=UPI00168BA1A9|nr:SUMF1/EgtB/PvdO family nonheme iron enzyme [Nostoc sp. FACHB-280]MBD2494311.1 SUMF1/EgtB/PvdO family nonheme iron enzyme [Nostoc sp. FACHB-280]